MKKALIITTGIIWIGVLSFAMNKAFAYQPTNNERYSINSDYNSATSNPTNYHRDEGYGLHSVN